LTSQRRELHRKSIGGYRNRAEKKDLGVSQIIEGDERKGNRPFGMINRGPLYQAQKKKKKKKKENAAIPRKYAGARATKRGEKRRSDYLS